MSIKEAHQLIRNEKLKKEAIRKSFAYNWQLLRGDYTSLKELCKAKNIDVRHTRRIPNLRFLAGDILERILTDRMQSIGQ